MRKYEFYSTKERNIPYFNVSGGPFASSQTMGMHITCEKGFTSGVSTDRQLCELIIDSQRLMELLKKMDVNYHLSERHDDGYLQADDKTWNDFKELSEKYLK